MTTVPAAPAASVARPGAEPLLVLADLTVRFGGLMALDRVSLSIGFGEVLGVIGPNGAGKTTVLNAIGRLVPSTGTISFQGRDMRHAPVHRLRALGLSRSFQHPQLDTRMTVRQVVGLGTAYQKFYGWPSAALGSVAPRQRRSKRAIAAEIEPIIATLGLEQWRAVRIVDAPHGVRKLADIARAMVGSPALLLLDEPFAGLSQDESDKVIEVVRRRQHDSGTATLLIDHHVESVVSAANVLLAMVDGRVAAYGDPKSVLANESVKVAYLG